MGRHNDGFYMLVGLAWFVIFAAGLLCLVPGAYFLYSGETIGHDEPLDNAMALNLLIAGVVTTLIAIASLALFRAAENSDSIILDIPYWIYALFGVWSILEILMRLVDTTIAVIVVMIIIGIVVLGILGIFGYEPTPEDGDIAGWLKKLYERD